VTVIILCSTKSLLAFNALWPARGLRELQSEGSHAFKQTEPFYRIMVEGGDTFTITRARTQWWLVCI